MKHRNATWIALVAISALALVATACNSSSSTTSAAAATTSTSTSSSTETDSGEAPANVQGKTSFELEADNFSFEPATLEGSAGQTLDLTVKNAGSADHTFTIDDQNIDVTLSPGDEQEITVTFPDSGTVEFYCRFHESSGMMGTLEVM